MEEKGREGNGGRFKGEVMGWGGMGWDAAEEEEKESFVRDELRRDEIGFRLGPQVYLYLYLYFVLYA